VRSSYIVRRRWSVSVRVLRGVVAFTPESVSGHLPGGFLAEEGFPGCDRSWESTRRGHARRIDGEKVRLRKVRALFGVRREYICDLPHKGRSYRIILRPKMGSVTPFRTHALPSRLRPLPPAGHGARRSAAKPRFCSRTFHSINNRRDRGQLVDGVTSPGFFVHFYENTKEENYRCLTISPWGSLLDRGCL